MARQNSITHDHLEHETVSYIEENGTIKEVVSLPSDFFAVKCHHLDGRSIHTHNCIEMFYILSGSCTHVIETRPGLRQYETLEAGNYYVMDHQVSHGFERISRDFHLSNLLFMPRLIDPSLSNPVPGEQLISTREVGFPISGLAERLFNKKQIDKNGKILRLFERAWQTYKAHEIGTQNLFRCYVTEILIITLKNLYNDNKELGQEQIVTFLCAYMDKHYAEPISFSQICAEKNWNMSYVSRKFREVMGTNLENHLQDIRCQNACILLLETRMKIEEIGEAVGYPEPCYFRKIFKRKVGISASSFRRYIK